MMEDNQKFVMYEKKAADIRRLVVRTLHRAGGSFLGGSLSSVDLLTVLYFGYMKIEKGFDAKDRDLFILSKGHCSSALYATLVLRGIMDESRLDDYGKDGSTLGIHPKKDTAHGIEVSSGSLGHGLSLAAGSALAAKILHSQAHTFVLMGDGECNEGSVWENAAFCSRQKLNHLTVIIDRNRIQGCGRDRDVLDYGDMVQKFQAFGFDAMEIDGHNYSEIDHALERAVQSEQKPVAIIADTIKGKGVSFMEDRLEWHYQSTSDEQFQRAMEELS